MKTIWAEEAIKLLEHAREHMLCQTSFDNSAAFISIDNAVEVMFKTYLSLPDFVMGMKKPAYSELKRCGSNFNRLVELMAIHYSDRFVGIDPAQIIRYHKIRNRLYHEPGKSSVCNDDLNNYYELAKLLLEYLFGVSQDHDEENLFLLYSKLEENVVQIFGKRLAQVTDEGWRRKIEENVITESLYESMKNISSAWYTLETANKNLETDSLRAGLKSEIRSANKVLDKIIVTNKIDVLNQTNFFYYPSISELIGVVEIKEYSQSTFIGDGFNEDELNVKVPVIALEKPINVYQDREFLEEGVCDHTMYGIDLVQFYFTRNAGFSPKSYIGRKVCLRGTLFAWHTAHHYTPILLETNSCTLLNKDGY